MTEHDVEYPAWITATLFLSSVAVALPLRDAETHLEPFLPKLAKLLEARDERIRDLATRLERAERKVARANGLLFQGWSR